MPRIADGDADAVRECVDRYGGLIWSLALRMFRDRPTAEDAVQEVFIQIWRKAAQYDPDRGSEDTFVGIVARRRLLQELRKRKRDNSPSEMADDVPVEEAADPLERMDDSVALRACWDELTSDQQTVLRRSVFDGLSYPEIAGAVDRPIGTIKTWARSGLKKLAGCWNRKEFAETFEGTHLAKQEERMS